MREPGNGRVDLPGHRFGVKLVQVALGGSGKELRATHAQVLGAARSPRERLLRH